MGAEILKVGVLAYLLLLHFTLNVRFENEKKELCQAEANQNQ